MKNKFKYILFSSVLALGTLTSCNDFLDKMPDNRTTVDTEDKVKELLVSAYFNHDYNYFTEVSSDNVDEYQNDYTIRFIDQLYKWEDPTETNNESPESYWETAYSAIAAANTALEGIDNLGGATSTTLKECKGEALLCRAYAHFMLVNIFCKNYNTATSGEDLGVYYQYNTGSEIGTAHDRGTVAEVYEKIDKDIQEALPLIGDSHYDTPKYHFNKKAAYAFATRFYLYYEKWDKAIEYANLCLGSDPKSLLRDWSDVGNMTATYAIRSEHYVSSELNCNLLLSTGYSNAGLAFGPYTTWKKYAHGPYLSSNEDASAQNIWGSGTSWFYDPPREYPGTTYSFTIFWRVPYMFQYTDAVAGIGYRKSIFPLFTTDETLLNRAEAYVMKNQYDKASSDLTMWMQNITKSKLTLDPDTITKFYNSVKYSYSDSLGLESTVKKHLNPAFTIDKEGSTQEAMLQCVLGFRRIETMHNGLRWFDIKRYGIEFPRRTMSADGVPLKKTDFLGKDDPRRAIQLPSKVLDAGVTPNPRN